MTTQSIEPPLQRSEWQPDAGSDEQIGTVAFAMPESAWLSFLDVTRQIDTWRVMYVYTFKRLFDIVFAFTLLVILSVPLLLVAVVIALDLGAPVLFRQVRVGKNGRRFVMYKFRTMRHDRRQDSQPFAGEDRRKCHKTRHDPRVTRLGRILRRTSIDELPQLFNVLRGDMSLIGPRPELPAIVDRYAPWQHQRHLVRPGLTGWWQVQGRGSNLMHEHTDLDIYYVNNISLRLDCYILLRTIAVVLFQSGAY